MSEKDKKFFKILSLFFEHDKNNLLMLQLRNKKNLIYNSYIMEEINNGFCFFKLITIKKNIKDVFKYFLLLMNDFKSKDFVQQQHDILIELLEVEKLKKDYYYYYIIEQEKSKIMNIDSLSTLIMDYKNININEFIEFINKLKMTSFF